MNKCSYILLVVLLSLSSCNNIKNGNDISNKEKLAFELCGIYSFDQGVRNDEFKHNGLSIVKLFGITDSINFNKLMNFIELNGYPNEKLLGKYYKYDCVNGATTVVLLHNAFRIVKEEKYFDLLLSEVNKGNMSREGFATVLDKYYWGKSHGKEVLYGSQFGKPCLRDKVKTNKARFRIGLKPLKDTEFKKCDK